jgi:hypothetical protein
LNAPIDPALRAHLDRALREATLDAKYALERGRAFIPGRRPRGAARRPDSGQVPITPPPVRVITIVAERGRVSPPSGQWLVYEAGVPIAEEGVSSPGCWMFTNSA